MYFFKELLRMNGHLASIIATLFFPIKTWIFWKFIWNLDLKNCIFFHFCYIKLEKSVRFVIKTCYRSFLAKLQVHKWPILETHFGVLKGFRGPCGFILYLLTQHGQRVRSFEATFAHNGMVHLAHISSHLLISFLW